MKKRGREKALQKTHFLVYGIAVVLVPIMNIYAAFGMLALISLYDFWAVFKTKHMVSLAKGQQEANVFTGLMIPYVKEKVKFKFLNIVAFKLTLERVFLL